MLAATVSARTVSAALATRHGEIIFTTLAVAAILARARFTKVGHFILIHDKLIL